MAKICPSCKAQKSKNLCMHEKVGLVLVIIVALIIIARLQGLF